MRNNHVRLVGVTKRFGTITAVDTVSFDVPEGKFVTLLGPSGCGKTTTLRLIAGFYDPDTGDIHIGDRAVKDIPPERRGTAMVFQDFALFPHMKVFDNIAYGLQARRMPRSKIGERVSEVRELLRIQGLEDKFPHQLSGGQQQRVALARALVVEPEVLLLDEPLSNLDAKLRVRVRTELRQLQQQFGKTTIYVTHDQSEALALSDIVVVMNKGRIEQVGTPVELYRRPVSRFVADFIGDANLLPAKVGEALVTVGGYSLSFEQPGVPSGMATLMVRPEAIRFGDHGDGLPGRVRGVFFMGMFVNYVVETEVGIVTVIDPHGDGLHQIGSEVKLQFVPDKLCLLPEAPSPDRGTR